MAFCWNPGLLGYYPEIRIFDIAIKSINYISLRLPPILILHLKRFTGERRKNNALITYPIDNLVLEGSKYELKGITLYLISQIFYREIEKDFTIFEFRTHSAPGALRSVWSLYGAGETR